MRVILLIIFLFFFELNTCYSKVVLIDPGHGGEEKGAIVSGKSKGVFFEKDLALRVSRAIKLKLGSTHQVYLTRSYDKTISLGERALMAQKVGADIFISVHANASESSQSHGIETFYLDNVADEAVKKVVRIENQGAKDLEGNDLSNNPVIQQILAELVVEQTVPLSKKLATDVHKFVSRDITKPFKMNDRGIKPGLFYVLAMSKVPGILLEMGFMSNPKDLSKMNSEKFVESYSSAVAQGVIKYFEN